jgi:hypothetical protein
VFVAGFAAAVIWLAAWRRRRPVTVAGVVAFLIAAGIHSLHDGIVTFFHVRPNSFNASLARTLRQAIDRGLTGMAVALVLAAFLYLLARHGARELTAPGDIADSPPAWRPQLKPWGCDPRPPPVFDPLPGPWYAPAPAAAAYASAAAFGPPQHYGPPPTYGAAAHGAPAPAPVPGGWTNPPVAPLPVLQVPPAPQPVSAGSPSAPNGATPLHVPPPVGPPPVAPPGWYQIAGDPGNLGWWTGAAWTRVHRWDGTRWWPQ